MEVQRSTRHRSLGIDSRSNTVNHARAKRPSLSDRHRSAPLVPRLQPDLAHLQTPSDLSQHSLDTQESSQQATAADAQGNCPTVNLVVFGHPRVGKSTFIRNALNLDKSVSTTILSSKLCLESFEYRIRLSEVKFDDIKVVDGHTLKWPHPVGGDLLPSIDGALCLYDLTNENSIIGLPQTLHALNKAKVPVMLVACKADAPISEQEVGITFIERSRRSVPLATFGEASSTCKESARKCLNIALKTTLAINKLPTTTEEDLDGNNLTRLRTNEFVQTFAMATIPPKSVPETDIMKALTDSCVQSSDTATFIAPVSGENATGPEIEAVEAAKNDIEPQKLLETEKKALQESQDQLEMKLEKLALKESPRSESEEGGVPLSDLVDRLLQMPATKNDSKFVPAFLCLYRAFATPRRLLAEIIDRFYLIEESDLVPLTKAAELLRYLQVLAQWTANYPGDFAAPRTRRRAISFARELEQTKNFAPSAKEIISNLLTIIMDDDRDWAYEDKEEIEKLASRRTTRSSFYGEKFDLNHQTESDNSDDDRDMRRRSIRNSGTGSTASSTVRSSVTSSQSATNLFNLDNAREQSKLLKAVPHVPLDKLHWRQFMSTPTEELAREITRMDWIMYSAIRARDFVRHVNLSSQQRARLKHGDTIGMMVKHFNHLALFVSSMILLRDKPKDRAIMLEKFMDLAWKVRQLNNYNSLGAIVAGITGPEISRLKHTYELVPSNTQKQFLRLTVLMSISRSHAAYRMAWENSFAERIPFIPLVRQDLTMAASANQTFIGKNINWKKFEIMGDVIVGIQRSHEQPYAFPEKTQRSQEITHLILETKVIEESEDSADPRGELYERSLQLEPLTIGDSRKSLANFSAKRTRTGWF